MLKIKLLLSVCTLAFAVTGCHRQNHSTQQVNQVGTHKVTVKRTVERKAMSFGYVEEHGNFYQYNEKFLWWHGMTVKIDNEKVTVKNRELGTLKPNDAVNIGADGVTVITADGKELDYGQTEAYLKGNAQETPAAVSQNQPAPQPYTLKKAVRAAEARLLPAK